MSNLTKQNYALAAYCFIHAMLQAAKPELKDEADDRLADLEDYFRNKNGIEDRYEFLCEKAVMLGIFGGGGSTLKGLRWNALLSKTLGFPAFGVSGQQVRALKRKNPSLFTPLATVTQGLLKYLADPSEEKIEACAEDLIRLDKFDWMEYFHNALTYNPTHPNKQKEQIATRPNQLIN
jgi:hypothetical protein